MSGCYADHAVEKSFLVAGDPRQVPRRTPTCQASPIVVAPTGRSASEGSVDHYLHATAAAQTEFPQPTPIAECHWHRSFPAGLQPVSERWMNHLLVSNWAPGCVSRIFSTSTDAVWTRLRLRKVLLPSAGSTKSAASYCLLDPSKARAGRWKKQVGGRRLPKQLSSK